MESIVIIGLLGVSILFLIFEMYTMVRSYSKAGITGWKAIIPIWNILSLFRLANLSNWMVILIFIPGANIYIAYLVYAALADRLGKKRIFALGLLFLPVIFFPILAFSKEKNKVLEMENEYSLEEDSTLMNGPIEPLGAMPDLDEIYGDVVESVPVETIMPVNEVQMQPIYENPVNFNEQTNAQNSIPNSEIVVEPITPVVAFDVQNPMHAMEKVQYIEEEKEKNLNLDEYKVCPNCGTKLGMDATVCFLCGKRFEEE